MGLDLLFHVRGEREPPEEVLVVALDEASADQLRLPRDTRDWPRSYYAGLVRRLAEAGAGVIAFDLLFGEARPHEEDDRELALALREAGNVVLLSHLQREVTPLHDSGPAGGRMIIEVMTPPTHVLQEEALYFAPFPLPKYPGKVSQYWVFRQAGDAPTLPAAALQIYALPALGEFQRLLSGALADARVMEAAGEPDRSAREEAEWLLALDPDELRGVDAVNRLVRAMRAIVGRDTLIARDLLRAMNGAAPAGPVQRERRLLKAAVAMYRGEATRYLDFYGPARTIRTVPVHQLMQDGDGPAGLDLRDKAVFVGVSDTKPYNLGDTHSTVFSRDDGLDLSGVEIAATAFGNLLEGREVRPLHPVSYVSTVALFGIAAGAICFLLGPLTAALVLAGMGGSYFFAAGWRFAEEGLWYPIVVPLTVQAPAAFVLAVTWKYLDARKIERAHAQLKELDRLKSMFLSHVSHELKTPLTSIRGFADNMMSGLTGELGPKQHDYLRRIRANTDRLTRMIANLLDVSRIESGIQQLERAPVSVCQLVQDGVAQLQLMAATKGVVLEVACPDPSLRALLDPDRFTQVLTNLVENAIKFTPAGGSVSVTASLRAPGQVEVIVADTGEGIPPEAIARLFEPFYQAGRRPANQGLGLGLSIVRTLVDLHGGTITVRSELGKGSEFRVTLPALAEPAAAG